ncbi:DUF305 domain-containing protein [Brevundimonas sp.]|uniref:DUF305 domain-containing protein n=1 Tax=Brevundimonas sp. TaxID=1871086 RepID=UPI002731F89D|nr:DUF305 domain-containing protein [Brevundimonas sp.]MDP1914004.1 DUF305 domain-containing protein [Brevundimonas sp.]
MRVSLTTLLASLVLTACDGGGDPVQQALRETAAVNQSATVRETAAVYDPASTDQAWVNRMVARHREAIAAADVVLAQSRDPEIRRMAEAVKDARTHEIAEMQAWKPSATPGQ